MSIIRKNNFEIAKEQADADDRKIIDTLSKGKSFRVEAGAGSGKTYSLNKALEWIQANRWNEYHQKKQIVACITFTNAAVEVIASRLPKDTFITPSTIHSFAWNSIKQYQTFLINIVTLEPEYLNVKGDSSEVREVSYTLGIPTKENGIYYLGHNHVLDLFGRLLDNQKFRRVFTSKYPIILIDEYQDTNRNIIEKFVEYFISKNKGPQFGFFGDSWQTIYQFNNACGLIEHENLEVINKTVNFRSTPKIVELLNCLRKDLPQSSAIDNIEGEVIAVTCDDYKGIRQTGGHFNGELPSDVFRDRIERIRKKVQQGSADGDSLKILMITHKTLARQQGYEQLLNILNNGLKQKEDPFLVFFMEIVEPIYRALKSSNMQLLFETLGISRFPIRKKSDKLQWRVFLSSLEEARRRRAADVFKVVLQSNLVPIPQGLIEWYDLYQQNPTQLYISKWTIQSLLNLQYSQFISAIDFLYPQSIFSTEHSVKGEEYDTVVFVISKGWNNYQFETYAPMITGISSIPQDKKDEFERNRNLFYVCCSRPKKKLIFFITVPIDEKFRAFLKQIIDDKKIFTYSEFISQ